MIGIAQIDTLLSRGKVSSTSGESIGKVGQVYLDDDTGQPEWVTVKTGFFGTSESFVPIADAELHDDEIRVPYDKAKIKDAPRMDEDGHLSEAQEAELYAYYGLSQPSLARSANSPSAPGRTETSNRAGRTSGVEGRTTGTQDDAMTRSEEQLRVGKEKVEAGRARLRKYVVTEQQQVEVPVTREEVRVEREPITTANRGKAMDGPDISEDEHEVVLHEERPVVTTEAQPVERVRLKKDTVTDTETVSGEVRKEKIDTDTEPGGKRADRR